MPVFPSVAVGKGCRESQPPVNYCTKTAESKVLIADNYGHTIVRRPLGSFSAHMGRLRCQTGDGGLKES